MVGTQAEWNVRKRDGRMVPFDGSLIARAISNAFRAELNLAETQPLEDATLEEIARMTEEILAEMAPLATASDGIEVEKVQDLVEMELMRRGHYRIARRYIVYRSEHAKVRALRRLLKIAKDRKDLTNPEFWTLYKKVGGNTVRNKAHLRLLMDEIRTRRTD